MRVSVCIPTYNQSTYLEQAVRSAVAQTLLPVEIIVADDCSTDDTADVLKRLSTEIPMLKVIRQTTNRGITHNTNTCLRVATGDFVIRLDSDDRLAPDYLKSLAELLQRYPDAGYAHADVQEVDQNGKHLAIRKLARGSTFQSPSDALRAARKGYRVAANIIMFRRAALCRVGFITAKTNFAEDYHLSASLAAAGYGNVYLNKVLSYYRVWIDNGKARQRRKLAEIAGIRNVFEEVLEPAYRQRQWSLRQLTSSRKAFACNHADCLGWKVYNLPEKNELAAELKKLSGSLKVRFLIWLHLKGFGESVAVFSRITSIPRSVLKALYIRVAYNLSQAR